jgi:hypothetical protein
MRKVSIILDDSFNGKSDDDLINQLSADLQVQCGQITVEKYVPTPSAEKLAEEFIASSPTEEPTKEAPLFNPTTEEYNEAPTPEALPEGGIREESTL